MATKEGAKCRCPKCGDGLVNLGRFSIDSAAICDQCWMAEPSGRRGIGDCQSRGDRYRWARITAGLSVGQTMLLWLAGRPPAITEKAPVAKLIAEVEEGVGNATLGFRRELQSLYQIKLDWLENGTVVIPEGCDAGDLGGKLNEALEALQARGLQEKAEAAALREFLAVVDDTPNTRSPRGRGLLMSQSSMKRLILGKKTQTRRDHGLGVVNQEPDRWHHHELMPGVVAFTRDDGPVIVIRAPHQPGDGPYIKETWAPGDDRDPPALVWYRADGSLRPRGTCLSDQAPDRDPGPPVWKPSILMPRSCSRYTVVIGSVSIERLPWISVRDSMAEGCFFSERRGFWTYDEDLPLQKDRPIPQSPREAYQEAFEAQTPGAWERGIWVWVYTFRLVPQFGPMVGDDDAEA